MKNQYLERIFNRCDKEQNCSKKNGIRDYITLLNWSNGVEGYLTDSFYLSVYSIEQAITSNNIIGIDTYHPGMFLFASRGDDACFLINMKDGAIFESSFTNADPEDTIFRASGIHEFLDKASNGEFD